MNVRNATADAKAANLPVRGLIYSVVFGIGAWGIILGAVWLVRSALA